MPRLIWDRAGEHLYETGVDRGVFYKRNNAGAYTNGVAWNGLTAVTERPSGAEATKLWADNMKYLNLISAEEFAATIEAYTYPREFEECDGSATIAAGVSIGQQNRTSFGFCYRTIIGNDIQSNNYGYKLHLVYGATAAPSERSYGTVNESPDAITFSWECNTVPENVTGKKPTASLTVDSTLADPAKLAALEDILYGTAGTEPRLPLPDEVMALMGTSAIYAVNLYLTGVESSNTDATTGATYTTTLTAAAGKAMKNVIVLVAGEDVTEDTYTSGTGVVSISDVDGAVTIYATAA